MFNEKYLRYSQFIFGIILLIGAWGLYRQAAWATELWPWTEKAELSRLSAIFLSSILAAIGVPTLWIALSGEESATEPGSLDLMLTLAGAGIFMLKEFSEGASQKVLYGAIFCFVIFISVLGLYLHSRQAPVKDTRRMPLLVRLSFGGFAVILTTAGTALVLNRPNIFPWPLAKELSVVYGWIFLGGAVYFIHGVLYPSWRNAAGQLAGFLAYDLILIVPFIQHFETVNSDLRPNLIIYVAVIIYSGVLAAYFLLIHPSTRLWATQPLPDQPAHSALKQSSTVPTH